MASASNRFSFAFSSSSAFSRLAYETSSPPYFAFHVWNVALLIPCFRHASTIETPASCSRKIPMICSCVNLSIASSSGPSFGSDSSFVWRKFSRPEQNLLLCQRR